MTTQPGPHSRAQAATGCDDHTAGWSRERIMAASLMHVILHSIWLTVPSEPDTLKPSRLSVVMIVFALPVPTAIVFTRLSARQESLCIQLAAAGLERRVEVGAANSVTMPIPGKFASHALASLS